MRWCVVIDMRARSLVLCFAAACHVEPAASAAAPASAASPVAVVPAASSPIPASTTTPVADASIEALNADAITCVLADRRVAQYLHAEIPDRVPVKLHLASTITIAKTPEAAGAPVVVTDASAALVDVQRIDRAGTSATVTFEIPGEGVFGEVECHRDGEAWVVGKAKVVER